MKDLFHDILVKRSHSPVSPADDTAQVGQIIDRANFESVTFLIATGAIADADATFAVTMDHGETSNLADAVAVPAAELLGTLAGAGFQFDSDNQTRKVGYVGVKRFVRLTITPTNNASAAFLTSVCVLARGRKGSQTSQS